MADSNPARTPLADLRSLHPAVVQALSAGAALCRYMQPRLRETDQITKSDASPVTTADLACQALIHHHLRQSGLLEMCPMLAEESASIFSGPSGPALLEAVCQLLDPGRQTPASTSLPPGAPCFWPGVTPQDVRRAIDDGRPGEIGIEGPGVPRRYWTLDPIDGTRGFVAGRAYAVCLALVDRGQPVLCALACPTLPPSALHSTPPSAPNPDADADAGCLLIASARPTEGGELSIAGTGVEEYPLSAQGVGATASLVKGVLLSRPSLSPSTAEARWALGVDRSERDIRLVDAIRAESGARTPHIGMDSQAKYALLVRDLADVYLRLHPRMRVMRVWDHAAGIGLCQAIGYEASTLQGATLDFAMGCVMPGPGILVAPPGVRQRLVETAARYPEALLHPGSALGPA